MRTLILTVLFILYALTFKARGDQTFSTPTHFRANSDWLSGITLDFGGNRLRNIGTPTSNTDAATKLYVDSVISGGGVVWGGIGGTITDQADLQAQFTTKVSTTRTLTINGTTQDLSSNRTWSVGTVTSLTVGALSPLFTSSVGGTSAIPAVTFSLSTAAAHRFFGNNTASTAVPAFEQVNFTDLGGVASTAQAGLPIGGATGQILQKVNSGDYNTTWVTPTSLVITGAIVCVFDGQGSPVSGGADFYISAPYTGTITEAILLGDTSGSIIIEVRKCSYAQFDAGATHPVAGDKINSFTPPTLSSATKSDDTTLSGWTTGFTAGDVFGFHVNGTPTAIKRATLLLKTVR